MGITKKNAKLRKECWELIDRIGLLNFKVGIYAKQVGVPIQTASSWKQIYIKNMMAEDPKEFINQLMHQNKNALNNIAKITMNKNSKNALAANKAILELTTKYLETMQRMGLIKSDEESPESQVIIAAKDKDLYNILSSDQKKEFAKLIRHKGE